AGLQARTALALAFQEKRVSVAAVTPKSVMKPCIAAARHVAGILLRADGDYDAAIAVALWPAAVLFEELAARSGVSTGTGRTSLWRPSPGPTRPSCRQSRLRRLLSSARRIPT